ncbi:hypothetical protein BGZ83_009297 [Gryganskiella cystojenkinii]|nr:hypothetical protein BGZ83_009297 [Gryganskiella cystojenkinii]
MQISQGDVPTANTAAHPLQLVLRVFALPELAEAILCFLVKDSILSLRQVCKVFNRAVAATRWLGKSLLKAGEFYLDEANCHRSDHGTLVLDQPLDPDSIRLKEFKQSCIVSLGTLEKGIESMEADLVLRAVREWPNLATLRLAILWEQEASEVVDFLVKAVKYNTEAVVAGMADMEVLTKTMASSSLNTDPDQQVVTTTATASISQPILGLRNLYLRVMREIGPKTALEPLFDGLASCRLPLPQDMTSRSSSSTCNNINSTQWSPSSASLPISPTTLPILPHLTVLDLSARHTNEGFVVHWETLVRFVANDAPNLKELWMNRVDVTLRDYAEHEGPVIPTLKILGLRCIIPSELARRVIRTFPRLEELSVHRLDTLWQQSDTVNTITTTATIDKSMHSWAVVPQQLPTSTSSPIEDEEKFWTPFPDLKFLRLRSPNQREFLPSPQSNDLSTILEPTVRYHLPECFDNLFLEGGPLEGLQTTLALDMSRVRLTRLTIGSHADWDAGVDVQCDHLWAKFLMRPCCESILSVTLFHRTSIIQALVSNVSKELDLEQVSQSTSTSTRSNHMPLGSEMPSTTENNDEGHDAPSDLYKVRLRQAIQTKIKFTSQIRLLRLQGYWKDRTAPTKIIQDLNHFLHCCPNLTDISMQDGSVNVEDIEVLFEGLGRCPTTTATALDTVAAESLVVNSADKNDARHPEDSNHQRATMRNNTADVNGGGGGHSVVDDDDVDDKESWIYGERPHLQKIALSLSCLQDEGQIEKRLNARFRCLDELRLSFQPEK